jgi:predicted transcriptional regulator
MKTKEQIKRAAKKGDYTRAAEILEIDASLVSRFMSDDRADHHEIQKTLSEILESRERLSAKVTKRRARQMANA